MATDEALLLRVARIGKPVLRFYSWSEPAASFGYFQSYTEICAATHLRPLVRRPTGGGLVPHDRDWTYSAVFPRSHEWYRLRACQSYERIHEWVTQALQSLGVNAALTNDPIQGQPGRCFIGAERHDVVLQGVKIAGAAQRRNRYGLLIQGSIQPPESSQEQRRDWETAMLEVATRLHGIQWSNFEPPRDFTESARTLDIKYSSDAHLKRR